MGTDGTLRFPVALVRRHASTADEAADEMSQARSAVREVGLTGGAYGQLCQFLPALLAPVFGLALDALHGSTDALRETAVRLRTAATDTESTDSGASQRLTGVATRPGPTRELPL